MALAQGDYTSGVWIDDVVVKAESLAETPVWTETQTFEGPFEPVRTSRSVRMGRCSLLQLPIIVDATSEGACGNLESEPLAAQILSVAI